MLGELPARVVADLVTLWLLSEPPKGEEEKRHEETGEARLNIDDPHITIDK